MWHCLECFIHINLFSSHLLSPILQLRTLREATVNILAITSLPPGSRKGLLAPKREPRRRLPLEVAMPLEGVMRRINTWPIMVRWQRGKAHLAWNPPDAHEPWNEATLNLHLPTRPSLSAGYYMSLPKDTNNNPSWDSNPGLNLEPHFTSCLCIRGAPIQTTIRSTPWVCEITLKKICYHQHPQATPSTLVLPLERIPEFEQQQSNTFRRYIKIILEYVLFTDHLNLLRLSVVINK